MKRLKILVGLVMVGLMAVSFGLSNSVIAKERFVLISHAPDSDSWWNTIKNAVKQASKDMNVTVDYRNPPNGDLADMARLIEQSAARNYDGVIVTIADYDVLKKAIEKVVRKGIPVITINSGTQKQSRMLNAAMHVGQPEYDAGYGAGLKAKKDANIKSFLCVNHYATNPASYERCRGFAEAIGADFRTSTIDTGVDPTIIEKKVAAYLRKNGDTGAILALGPNSAHPTLRYLSRNSKAGKYYFATFDISGEIAKAIKSDVIAFAVDQQPYLQGYLPVVILTLKKRYGLMPGNNINSGPGFITKENIALVEKYAGVYR